MKLSAFLPTGMMVVGLTFAVFGAALPASPVMAQTGAYYTAELAQPTSETRAVAGGTAWRCAGSTCVAAKASSRPLRICRDVHRKLGQVARFTADGETLDAEDLARCNG